MTHWIIHAIIAVGGGIIGGLLADAALRGIRKRRTRRFMRGFTEEVRLAEEAEKAKVISVNSDDAA